MNLPAPQHPVALGMIAYVRSVFRLRVFGLEHLRIEPGLIVAASHRSDTDVPVLISVLYRDWSAAIPHGMHWPTFAATEDLFLRGFLAGYPPGLPVQLRRLLWPIRVGGVLERHLQCVPVREPERMRLVTLLRAAPDEPLDGRLPADLTAALRRRAADLGRPEPRRGADVLGGAYADLLWTSVDRASVPDPATAWRTHVRAAIADFHRLADAIDRGGVIIFPEGQPSKDGAIGPLLPGLASVARRGHARRVQPVAMAYDPLCRGRTRAYVSFAPPVEPAPGRLLQSVSDALRTSTPLTAGQLAARSVLETEEGDRGVMAFEDEAGSWVARARAEGRPVEPTLVEPGRRRQAIGEALAQARRRGAHDPLVARLARELESAHR